jgi:antitoxin ChpS
MNDEENPHRGSTLRELLEQDGTYKGVMEKAKKRAAEENVKTRHTLDGLLAKCDATAEISAEDQIWLDNPPRGRELI